MSQQVNSPSVVGVLLLIVVCAAILTLLTCIAMHKITAARHRRIDNQNFRAVRKARRDFS